MSEVQPVARVQLGLLRKKKKKKEEEEEDKEKIGGISPRAVYPEEYPPAWISSDKVKDKGDARLSEGVVLSRHT